MLEFEPAGPDAEDRPAGADDVEGGDGLGQQRGVPVGVAGDQGAQLYALGRGGQSAQSRVRLEHRLVGRTDSWQLIEVVHHEDGVEARGVGFLACAMTVGNSSLTPVP